MKSKATNEIAPKTRYEGKLTANSKRNRPPYYYKLSEKDHETIKAGLSRFISVYQIAAKIGCGYTTLKVYIERHPELKEVQKDAEDGMVEYAQGKLMQKISSGELNAITFFLERKAGWTNHQTIDANMPIPNIMIGVIPERSIPIDIGEPEALAEAPLITKKDESQTIVREPRPKDGDEEDDESGGGSGESKGGDMFDGNWDDDASSDGGMF